MKHHAVGPGNWYWTMGDRPEKAVPDGAGLAKLCRNRTNLTPTQAKALRAENARRQKRALGY